MFEEGVLSLPAFTLTCASGDAVGFPTIFSLDRSNGTLIEETDGPPATITFHHLSPRLRHSFEGALITQGFDHSAGSFSRRNVAARAAIAA